MYTHMGWSHKILVYTHFHMGWLFQQTHSHNIHTHTLGAGVPIDTCMYAHVHTHTCPCRQTYISTHKGQVFEEPQAKARGLVTDGHAHKATGQGEGAGHMLTESQAKVRGLVAHLQNQAEVRVLVKVAHAYKHTYVSTPIRQEKARGMDGDRSPSPDRARHQAAMAIDRGPGPVPPAPIHTYTSHFGAAFQYVCVCTHTHTHGVGQVFEDPQVKARGMVTEDPDWARPHCTAAGRLRLVASPLRLSRTPVQVSL